MESIFDTVKTPADNYMFKVNSRNTRPQYEICSKLTIKTPERRQWRRTGVFIERGGLFSFDYEKQFSINSFS